MSPQFAHSRHHLEALYQAAIAAANPATAVANHLHRRHDDLIISQSERYALRQGRVYLVSVGKAAIPMAEAAATILGDALHAGIVLSKMTPPSQPAHPKLRYYQGNHPISGPESVAATTAVRHLLQDTTTNDLVLCLISGGTSALLTQPRLSLAEWQALNRTLLASGCAIEEFNLVRRQLDEAKGGGLARWAAPARCVSLILSDVVGNPLPAIGSGPTTFTNETPEDALAVLKLYDVAGSWPLVTGARQPSTSNQQPATSHHIIGDVRLAAEAALAKAAELGFTPQLLTAHLQGEAREVGRVAAAIARDTPPGRCLILGGETTVTLRSDPGNGGRNTETALAAAIALEGATNVLLASLASDGEDGPTDVAGAMVWGETAVVARRHNLNPTAYLNRHDSYTFFHQLDQLASLSHPPTLLKPGPTATNVNDLLIILTYEASHFTIHNSDFTIHNSPRSILS